MQGADLVAGGIQQIGQIEVAYGALTHAGRIFAAHSAIGDTGGMPGFHLFGTLGIKAYGAHCPCRLRYRLWVW